MSEYVPGTCNIGTAEIGARRRVGYIGLVLTVALAVGLFATHAAPTWRLTLFLPAAGAASGFLQAWFHFCYGFGLRGAYNFGALGEAHRIEDAEARAADRRKSLGLAAGTVAVGLAVALVAFALP